MPTPISKTSAELSPARILELGLGFWGSKTLLTAIELGVFTKLCQGPLTSDELTQGLGLHSRSARDFFDALVSLGMLQRDGERYSNILETDFFLDRNKPSYAGGMLEMANARLYPFWGRLTEALRSGEPQNEIRQGQNLFDAVYTDPKRLRIFLQGMTGLSMGVARAIASKFPAELPPENVRASGYVDRIFQQIADDAMTHMFYGRAYGASYATDLTGEAIFLRSMLPESLATREARIAAAFTHAVPLFRALPIATLVRLRREEPECFVSYRNALNRVFREHLQGKDDLSESELRTVFADEIQPRIDEIKSRTQRHWKKSATNALKRGFSVAAVVAQPGSSRSGEFSRAVGLEQLSLVCPSRTWKSDGERTSSYFGSLSKNRRRTVSRGCRVSHPFARHWRRRSMLGRLGP